MMKNLTINKEKNIGQVLFIVEGSKTEFYILHKIFTKIFNYQFERITRYKPYRKYNNKDNPLSRILVINTEESNIKYIDDKNEYLNDLFKELIDEYHVRIDNAAIYYIFDRDNHSNTDPEFIDSLLRILKNSRDNDNYYMQGLLLLSYPCIESFTLSNFDDNSYLSSFEKGEKDIKLHLNMNGINQCKINETSLLKAAQQMEFALDKLGIKEYDLDEFFPTNIDIFNKQENLYSINKKYNTLSLLCIALLDLGLISVED
ncbi:hypothetical protein [Abyssisolibacter fermentans]|uniref:hypothetical protein n=1 Tax=Abyssisolibacter fermentans TaxID=1766203 RepID=UPI000832F20C|nr:hypothetical protein [Abyssisolibacter fermentans]